MKRIFNLIAIFLISEISPFIAAYIARIFNEPIRALDPDDLFLWLAVHHLFQCIIGILIIKVYFRKKSLKELGFNFQNKALGFRILKVFVPVWTAVIVIFFIASSLLVKDFGGYITSLYPPQIKYIIPKLAFDLLMLSAIGEEPIFRSFVGFGLQKYWSGTVKIFNWNVTYAALISSVIFMLAHINFDLYPFRIINIDPIKLTLNLVFGLFLAIVFEKTRSLLYTALAHTYSNLLIYICGFISAYLLQ